MINTFEAKAVPVSFHADEPIHPPAISKDSIVRTRAKLLGVLVALEDVASLEEAQASRASIALLREKLDQNRFYLTVVGQFKRGKTSFLNALLGAEVLPVAILPLTSIVTILRYGDLPKAEVIFQSGKQTRIDPSKLADYVTEKANPQNVKGVSHVVVSYPSEYLRGGVALVDTPGIGSVYTHNTQVTYDFLPQVDAAIFVTSPEPPITNAEIEFLADLASHVRKVFVILNKTDLLTASQLQEVMEFTRGSLPEAIARESGPVFPVSAAMALEAKREGDATLLATSGFARLQDELSEFLVSEKNAVFYASLARNARKLIADLRLSYELQIRAARMPVEELRTKLAELDRHLADAEQQREDSQVLLQNSVAQLSSLVEAQAMEFAEGALEPLRAEIRRHWREQTELGRKELAAEMDKFLHQRIENLFNEWRTQFEAEARERFQRATNRFAASVNELIASVRGTAGSLFGFSVGVFDATEELAELEPCGYFTDPVLDWGLGNIPLLLPSRLFRSYLLRVMLQKAETELERNATRVAFDYKKRLNQSLSLFLEGMTAKLNETTVGIRSALTSVLKRQQESSATAQLQLTERAEALSRLAECESQIDETAVDN